MWRFRHLFLARARRYIELLTCDTDIELNWQSHWWTSISLIEVVLQPKLFRLPYRFYTQGDVKGLSPVRIDVKQHRHVGFRGIYVFDERSTVAFALRVLNIRHSHTNIAVLGTFQGSRKAWIAPFLLPRRALPTFSYGSPPASGLACLTKLGDLSCNETPCCLSPDVLFVLCFAASPTVVVALRYQYEWIVCMCTYVCTIVYFK